LVHWHHPCNQVICSHHAFLESDTQYLDSSDTPQYQLIQNVMYSPPSHGRALPGCTMTKSHTYGSHRLHHRWASEFRNTWKNGMPYIATQRVFQFFSPLTSFSATTFVPQHYRLGTKTSSWAYSSLPSQISLGSCSMSQYPLILQKNMWTLLFQKQVHPP